MFQALQPEDPQQVGPYRIEARLGSGGMGRVYLGRSKTGRGVAVKVVHSDLADDQDFRHRFAREVALARTVSGFFTAGVVDADPQGTPPWLATAYVPGLSLDQAVKQHGPWQERAVLALGAGLAEALESIHAAGVVHRDLKPSNVLLASDGPRVIDFGISVAVEGSRLTGTGMAVGTPGFMSPEQLDGTPVGPPSDVFCLGSLLTYTATGQGPFGTGSWQGLWYRTVHHEPDLRALPPKLRAVVAQCLAKQPEQRPTATALLDELADSATDRTTVLDLFTESAWLPDPVAQAVHSLATRPLPANRPPLAQATVVAGTTRTQEVGAIFAEVLARRHRDIVFAILWPVLIMVAILVVVWVSNSS